MDRQDVQWRRAREAGLAPDDSVVVVDIGGTRAKLGVVSKGAPLDARLEAPVAAIRNGDPVAAIAGLIRRTAEKAQTAVDGVIVTVPGFIDRDFDTVLRTLNVPELEELRLASALTKALGVPVVLERDTVLLLEGECAAGAARGVVDVAGVFVGTGIGAAYIAEDRPFRGGGWALELGHVPFGGGRTLESEAGGAALAEIARTRGEPIADLFRGTTATDARIEQIVEMHALAIAGVVAALSPRAILLGGGVVAMKDYPWDHMARIAAANCPLPQAILPLDLRRAELGWASALHGALRAMRRHLVPQNVALSTPAR